VVESVRAKIREVPDFPHEGILFYDITTVLQDAEAFHNAVEVMAAPFRGTGIDAVVAMESRGFIFGTPIAFVLGAGFVPIRKLGKLPADTVRRAYTLEYGTNTLEMHSDGVLPGQRVLLVDDLLATGGTLAASLDMVLELGATPAAVVVLVELPALGGRERLAPYGVRVLSFISY